MTFKAKLIALQKGRKVFKVPSLKKMTFGSSLTQCQARHRGHKVFKATLVDIVGFLFK